MTLTLTETRPETTAPTDTPPETTTPSRPDPQAADPNCSWCGGTGEVEDPQGKKWPCIQCSQIDPGPW